MTYLTVQGFMSQGSAGSGSDMDAFLLAAVVISVLGLSLWMMIQQVAEQRGEGAKGLVREVEAWLRHQRRDDWS